MTKRPYYKKAKSIIVDESLPPQALDIEEAVLGSVLLESNSVDKFMSEFNADLFYKLPNKKIAEAIIELYLKNEPIDILSVISQLKKNSSLDEVGGPYYVTSLTNKIGSTANYEYHLKILQQEALKRTVIQVCTSTINKCFDPSEDIFDTFQDLQVNLDTSLKQIIKFEVKKVGQVHNDLIKESLEIAKKGVKSGITSGLRMVDNVTNGWQKSDLIILAGRPSMGKTAAAVSMIMNPALDKSIPVAIFSLEMSNQQLVSRMQSGLSEINVSSIVKKQLTTEQVFQIAEACKPLKNAPIYIDDTPNISLLELKGKARKLVRDNKVELIIIDYLQLMRSGLNIPNREQEIAEISRGLKGLAKELNIPVIALSQLSRSVEGRTDKKPMLSDLRESGQIEQDADMVMFCYRPEYYGIENYEIGNETFDSEGLFMLIIAKHRNGELGEIPLTFIGTQTKLTNHKIFSLQNRENNNTFVQENNKEQLSPNNDFLNNTDIKKSNEEDLPF